MRLNSSDSIFVDLHLLMLVLCLISLLSVVVSGFSFSCTTESPLSITIVLWTGDANGDGERYKVP